MTRMNREVELKTALRELLDSQTLAVLATGGEGHPYTSLVFFTATPDLAQLVFVTGRETRKFANLAADGRVSMLIDNRRNLPADFRDGVAVTATGTCRVVDDTEREHPARLHLARHPSLEGFMAEPDSVLVTVDVETYYLVSRFQDVAVLQMNS